MSTAESPVDILLVEDNPGDIRLLEEALRETGADDIRLLPASSFAEAVEKIAGGGTNGGFDAMLLDLSLPDSQGLETVRRALRHAPDLPVLVLTGAEDEAVGTEAVRLGAQDYLTKGNLDGRLVSRAIRYAIERKRAEIGLREARDELERRVLERTAQLSKTVDDLQEEVNQRIAAQRALRDSERRHRTLIERMPAVTYVVEARPDGETLFVSPQTQDLLGFAPQEFFDDAGLWDRLVHRDDLQRVRASRDRLSAPGMTGSIEYRLIARDGRVVWVREEAGVLGDGQDEGLVIQGVLVDVTEHQRMEQALRESEQRLRAVLSNAPVLLLAVDAEGTITLAEGLGGAAEAQGLGRVGQNVFAELDHLGEMQTSIARAIAGQNAVCELHLPDGRRLDLRCSPLRGVNGRVDGAIAVGTDITERRRAEQAVWAERRRLYSLLNVLPAYVALIGRDHQIHFANHCFLEEFRDPGDDPCFAVQLGRDTPCPLCPLERILTEHEPEDWEWPLPGGHIFHVWGYPFTELDGTELVLVLGVDVTAQREMEKRINETSEQERRAIGRDLHDTLGQELTGLAFLIKSFARTIAEQAPEESDHAEQLVTVANRAVSRVRALARGLDPVGLDREGLSAALRELAEHVHAVYGLDVEVHCDGDVDPGSEAVGTHLYRIAQEAMSNAAKHARARSLHLELRRHDDALVLKVADDGEGFTAGDQPAGMGLRTMRHRSHAVGGVLHIDSRPGQGTRVTCSVPRRSRRTEMRVHP